jgi:hypothetical protein
MSIEDLIKDPNNAFMISLEQSWAALKHFAGPERYDVMLSTALVNEDVDLKTISRGTRYEALVDLLYGMDEKNVVEENIKNYTRIKKLIHLDLVHGHEFKGDVAEMPFYRRLLVRVPSSCVEGFANFCNCLLLLEVISIYKLMESIDKVTQPFEEHK